MSTHDALILIGFSGVGKDELAKALIQKYPGFVNVKFSALTKDILAQAFRMPRSFLDGFDGEPKWREQELTLNCKSTGVTPLLLLQTLFYGAPYTDLHKLNVEYALSSVPDGSIPVFTDIRRQSEMNAVEQKYNPYVIHLVDQYIEPGKADGEVEELAAEYKHTTLHNTGKYFPVEKMLGYLTQRLANNTNLLKPRKPILHLFVECEPESSQAVGINYEPFQSMIDQCREALESVFSLPGSVVNARAISIFQALAAETATENLQLTSITEDCWMRFDKTHVSLLPKLREMANIQVHSEFVPYGYGLTTQELKNAKSV